MSVPMSSPYIAPGGRGDEPYVYDDSHSQGLVTFAGVMIMIAAVLNVLYGIAAVDKANFFVNDARYVFADLQTFGWFVVVLGVVQFFAALAIWRGTPWGRWFGVALRQREHHPADAVDPGGPGAGPDDPGHGHRRDLRAAGLRRPSPRRAGVTRAGGSSRGALDLMTIGASLFCIATGAILYFAVTAEFAGIDIQTVGVILMVIGVLGLVLGLVLMSRQRASPR